jgi:hypothetical protein
VKPSHRDVFALGLALAAAWFAHRFVLGLELVGWDTYPLIVTSRAHGLGDLLGGFTRELMDGRYPLGRFYRPLTTVSFAWDHALWGLEPLGYQLTNLLALLFCVASLYAVARRWLGSAFAAGVATLVFALHPAQLETVPVAARRADLLATGFLLCALRAQPLGARAPTSRLVLGALCAVLAMAAKETGVVALPLIAALHWLRPDAGDASQRTRRALQRSVLPAAALVGFFALRSVVLGGLGGHPGSSPTLGALRGLASAPLYARTLLMPQPWSERPALDAALTLVLAVGVVAALVGARRQRAALGRLGLLLAGWLLCLLVLTGISGERASWYAVPFVAPYALLLGCLAEHARAGLRGPERRAALLGATCVLALLASHVRYSGLGHRYEEWTAVSRQERDFLERFRTGVVPLGTGTPLERVGIRSALCLADYSVAAYAELVFPERSVRVVLHRGGPPTAPTAGAVTVDATPLPSPVLQRRIGGAG